jgi:ribosome-associated toxin RatA of RatAB toxin-antitoxin module
VPQMPELEPEWTANGSEASAIEPTSTAVDPALLQTVEVKTVNLGGRQRQISARIHLAYGIESIWQVLTDYDALADFIPNLVRSQRLEHPNGGIRLEQVGQQKALMLDFSARVVLDMEEAFPQTIRFEMVEGDFKEFSGAWSLEPLANHGAPETRLSYTVRVWPKLTMPVIAIERRIRSDLPLNLLAIQRRLQELFG